MQGNAHEVIKLNHSEATMLVDSYYKYGMFSEVAAEINSLLNSFIEGINSESSWVVMPPLAICRTSYSLAYLSALRKHHVQAMMNLRMTLEAGTRVAYLIANSNDEYFTTQQKQIRCSLYFQKLVPVPFSNIQCTCFLVNVYRWIISSTEEKWIR